MTEQSLQLVSAGRAPKHSWFDRIDPVYEVEWAKTVSSRWSDVSVYRHILEVDGTGSLSHQIKEEWSPLRRADWELFSSRAILTMASLHEWNSLTTMQLSTILGEGERAVWNTMNALHAAGMVRRMIPGWWTDGDTVESGSGSLWRLDRKSWTTQAWFSKLDQMEWSLLTGNLDPVETPTGANTSAAIRHNMIAVEVGLRAMEACPSIVGAWGEGHAVGSAFLDADTTVDRKNIADCVLVTRSGRVIVFEVTTDSETSSQSPALVDKAAAWAAITGSSPLDLHVVFLDVSLQDQVDRLSRMVQIGVEKEAPRYVSSQAKLENGQRRVHVAGVRDWFPITRGVSTEFSELRVWTPFTEEHEDLAPASMLWSDTDVVRNTLASLHTPSWVMGDLT